MTATVPSSQDTTKKATRKKIVASTAVLAGVAAVAGMGAFAVFTDSDSTTVATDAGQLDIELSSIDVTVEDIAPGDTVERPLTISLPDATNDGDLIEAVRFSYGVTDETAGTDDPALGGDGESLVTGADGLSYALVTCVGGTWTATPGPVGPYTCSGTEQPTASGKLSTIGTTTPATLGPDAFGAAPTTTGTFPTDAGDVELNTLVRLQLPAAADNDYENASVDLTFTGSAVQRDGIQR